MNKIIVIAVVLGCMASVAAPQGASAEEASSRGLLERLLGSFSIDGYFHSPPVSQPPVVEKSEDRPTMPPVEEERQRMPPQQQ